MHEFSISSEIVRTVLETTEKNNVKKVLSIQLEIGELTLLNVDQVIFWMNELFKGSIAEGAKIKCKKIKTRIRCEECQYQCDLNLEQGDDHQPLIQYSCPKCGSLQIMIEKGKECILKRIQAVR